jgi:hypothetical protein
MIVSLALAGWMLNANVNMLVNRSVSIIAEAVFFSINTVLPSAAQPQVYS